jgi:hypothetical protein
MALVPGYISLLVLEIKLTINFGRLAMGCMCVGYIEGGGAVADLENWFTGVIAC